MTLIAPYEFKKDLKAQVGNDINVIETSMFGPQYTPDGWIVVCNRPHITGFGREWFAEVLMENGKIKKVT